MLWSQDEINLLKEFLHVSRFGGRFEGPVEEASWEHIASNMTRAGAARGIALRAYTPRDVAWHYLSQIFPLFQPSHAGTWPRGGRWTLDEDDLLLHYLSSTRPGGRFEGPPLDGDYRPVADNMNRIGPMLGFHAREYTVPAVQRRYQKEIYLRLTGQERMRWGPWTRQENELLREYAHVTQGGSLDGEIVSTHRQIANQMNQEAPNRGLMDRIYTGKGVEQRLRNMPDQESTAASLEIDMPDPNAQALLDFDFDNPDDQALLDFDIDNLGDVDWFDFDMNFREAR